MPRRLRLATRGSPLALAQVALIADQLRRTDPTIEVEPVVVTTRGDRLSDAPLTAIGGQGVFVKEVQAAVLDGRADAAVHSAKDLPTDTPAGLVIAAVPPRADVRDALVGGRLFDLAAGAAIATGSARRRAQLANLRPDLTFLELRGNMARRLERAADGEIGAVVVAMAALVRLGWAERVDEVLPVSWCVPQVGQGALAVECKAGAAAVDTLSAIDDGSAHRALDAERSMLATLGAGCTLPVGAWARPAGLDSDPDPNPDAGLELDAMVASGDGRVVVRVSVKGDDPAALGVEAARMLEERYPEPEWGNPKR